MHKFFPLTVNHAERFRWISPARPECIYLTLGWAFLQLQKYEETASCRFHFTRGNRDRSIETAGCPDNRGSIENARCRSAIASLGRISLILARIHSGNVGKSGRTVNLSEYNRVSTCHIVRLW